MPYAWVGFRVNPPIGELSGKKPDDIELISENGVITELQVKIGEERTEKIKNSENFRKIIAESEQKLIAENPDKARNTTEKSKNFINHLEQEIKNYGTQKANNFINQLNVRLENATYSIQFKELAILMFRREIQYGAGGYIKGDDVRTDKSMDKKIALRLFEATKEKMQTAGYPGDIEKYCNDALKLVEDFYGRENGHYKRLLRAPDYSIETQREIVLAELESIIIELKRKIFQEEPITGPMKTLEAYLSGGTKINSPTKAITENNNKELKKVFIVHGHDEEMKQAVARVLQKLNLTPIILHELPDEGKTIIEKFEKYSDVDFAIILLSPDDFAHQKGASQSDGKFRARQNVIMELGYFIAKLGRNKVVALYRQNDDFEIPSDYLGVLYKPYIADWKYKLADEMKKIDPKIDKNLL